MKGKEDEKFVNFREKKLFKFFFRAKARRKKSFSTISLVPQSFELDNNGYDSRVLCCCRDVTDEPAVKWKNERAHFVPRKKESSACLRVEVTLHVHFTANSKLNQVFRSDTIGWNSAARLIPFLPTVNGILGTRVIFISRTDSECEYREEKWQETSARTPRFSATLRSSRRINTRKST